MKIFTNNSHFTGKATATRFLSPWYESGTAPTTTVQWRVPRPGTLTNLRITHNTGAGNGLLIDYTIRVNGVASALAVSLASTGVSGGPNASLVVVAAGDLIDLIVTKAASVMASPIGVVASVEFI